MASASQQQYRPRVLISNDDGITAPGLVALAEAIRLDGFAAFSVSAPSGERSAQSHCISIGKHLHAWELPVPGADEAFAVDGTPADSVMLATQGPLLRNSAFNLVVSGINRGDNCGLHVIYSGTVGAAREAACKDIPALAVSIDDHLARTEGQYAAAAAYTVAVMKAMLGLLPPPPAAAALLPSDRSPASFLAGSVVNLNVPKGPMEGIRGLYLAHQGCHSHFPDFRELEADAHIKEGHAGAVTLRAFRNAAGFLRSDDTPGCDSWAVSQGWAAMCPVGLRSDLPLTAAEAAARLQPEVLNALAAVAQAAAADLAVQAGGPPELVGSSSAVATNGTAAAAAGVKQPAMAGAAP